MLVAKGSVFESAADRDDPISSVEAVGIVVLRRPIADAEPGFPIQVESDFQIGSGSRILARRVFPS
jgi:hypothetical protein